ncbi:Golgin subfamily A member 7/ERF4 family-domain-containing protein [Xylaria bambusicola]|uniref:Golgin subfamily A member 7/ERF4 family-domain-containing protein n=1 Tax=Xylaria bambusicola TaxID=326684 RepID=UPI002007AA91|nr:Golgin subfamily A member 7/ERF4 family-domain-containing protein [Xylaria bambusicola]KAI0527980.1 Golgin subfamily A member 7/ERF4 family-domain-containing protein [Xylaria bambusicola]
MPVLEAPLPACMNSANLFLSSPLSAITKGDHRFPLSSRNGPAHHDGRTTRLRRQPNSRTRHLLPISQQLLLRKDITSLAVAAAFELENPVLESTLDPTRSHPRHPHHHHIHSNVERTKLAHSNRFLPPPLRNRATRSESVNLFPRNIGNPGRLWNPTNSTPRTPPAVYTRPSRTARKRRPSTPPPPAVPFNHSVLDETRVLDDQGTTGAGDCPLLTLPEQRQSRHPTPTRSSFQIEERRSEGKRISLPNSVRYSFNFGRTPVAALKEDQGFELSELNKEGLSTVGGLGKVGHGVTEIYQTSAASQDLIYTQEVDQPFRKIDKGKGKAVMSSTNDDNAAKGLSIDLERGPARLSQQNRRSSNLSIPGGIGSAISSNSSIIGDPDQPGLGDEWGPQHPCFPHLNPYVPINSNEYNTTRIIRIRRDWLIAGDLGPAFSNMYPEILDPAGIPEREFRRVIEKLNGSLIPIFNPYSWRNMLDGVLGVLTAWLWEDLGFTNAKTKLNELEGWIDKWNAEMEKTIGSEEGVVAPKIISLRRSGYMSLDFQIPNPEVSISTSEPGSRSGPPPPDAVASTAA